MLALRLSWTAWGRGMMMPPVVEGARAMWDSEMVSMRGRLASNCSMAWAVKERNCISKPWQFSGGLGREQQWSLREVPDGPETSQLRDLLNIRGFFVCFSEAMLLGKTSAVKNKEIRSIPF